jgi:hypothetical protein
LSASGRSTVSRNSTPLKKAAPGRGLFLCKIGDRDQYR